MLKIFGSLVGHLLAGLLVTVVVVFIGTHIAVGTAPDDLDELGHYIRALHVDLLVWFFLAFTLMLIHIQRIKIDPVSLLARQVLLWGPISVGWYFTTQGYDGSLILGMFVSSIVLVYEVRVWRRRTI